MAKVNIRSPCFGYNKNVEIEAGVSKLPQNISCIIGNSLFKRYPQLSDILTVRRVTDSDIMSRPDRFTQAVNRDTHSDIDHDAQTTNGQADWHAQQKYVTRSNHHGTDKVIQTPGGHVGLNELTTLVDATGDNYTDMHCPSSVTDT